MENRWDMLEWLGPDASERVLTCLEDPADLARASSVSRSWRQFVASNEFGKRLCLRIWPELSNFTRVEVLNRALERETGSSSNMNNSTQPETLEREREREHVVYTYITHCLLKPNSYRDCTLRCIGASSTDNFPEESIENTLKPSDRVDLRPSYWSSGGQIDSNVPECLVYRLESDLYIVDEIRIQPFKAFFQPGHPIYSANRVRFKMGHSKFGSFEPQTYATGEEESHLTTDDNYVWTCISPEYPMSQENSLQSFKLPRPILCIGGVLKIDLLGRVQKQEMDGLYYICVCHVQVRGRPLSPNLSVDTSMDHHTVLRYDPYNRSATSADPSPISPADEAARSRWQTFADRIRQIGPNGGWNQAFINTLFGPMQFAIVEEDEDVSDDEFVV